LILGLWRGLLPTLLRDAPFSGLYLLFYRRQFLFFNSTSEKSEENAVLLSLHKRFLCGLSAGFFACLLTQPFDIVKTVVLLYPNKFGSSAKTSHDLYKVNFGGFEIY
jgi:solute carrier family 25 protein 38